MAQKQGSSSTSGGRLDASIGTELTAANFALGVGWGSAAVLAITTGSNDQMGRFTITASTTGVAQATATVVITFADGAYNFAPVPMVQVAHTNALDTGRVRTTTTTTAASMTFSTLPVDTAVYTFTYWFIAKGAGTTV